MNPIRQALIAGLALAFFGSETPAPAQTKSFQPPAEGVPAGRVGASTRGDDQRVSGPLMVIAKRGITDLSDQQNALLWHLAENLSGTVTVSLKIAGDTEPLYSSTDFNSYAAGYHRVDLPSLGVSLPAGKTVVLRLEIDTADATYTASGFFARDPNKSGDWLKRIAVLAAKAGGDSPQDLEALLLTEQLRPAGKKN